MKAARVFVLAAAAVKIFGGEYGFAYDEIITDQNSGNGAEKAGVADEPGENVTAIAGEELPGLHQQAHDGGDEDTGTKTDAARSKIREIVGRGDDVGSDVDVERGREQSKHGENHSEWIAEAGEDFDGIPEGFAEDDHGGGSDRDADEGVEGHRGGEAEGLADHLVALAASVAGEVGNVERNRGPETDHPGERRNEKAEEFAEGMKFGRRRKHGTEAAGFAAGPEKKGESNEKQER